MKYKGFPFMTSHATVTSRAPPPLQTWHHQWSHWDPAGSPNMKERSIFFICFANNRNLKYFDLLDIFIGFNLKQYLRTFKYQCLQAWRECQGECRQHTHSGSMWRRVNWFTSSECLPVLNSRCWARIRLFKYCHHLQDCLNEWLSH